MESSEPGLRDGQEVAEAERGRLDGGKGVVMDKTRHLNSSEILLLADHREKTERRDERLEHITNCAQCSHETMLALAFTEVMWQTSASAGPPFYFGEMKDSEPAGISCLEDEAFSWYAEKVLSRAQTTNDFNETEIESHLNGCSSCKQSFVRYSFALMDERYLPLKPSYKLREELTDSLSESKFLRALILAKALQKQEPKNFAVLDILSFLFAQLGLWMEGLKFGREVLRQENCSLALYNNLSVCCFGLGLWKESLHYATKASSLNRHPVVYANMGTIYLRGNKPKAAINSCRQALALRSDFLTPYRILVDAYKILGERKLELEASNKIEELEQKR